MGHIQEDNSEAIVSQVLLHQHLQPRLCLMPWFTTKAFVLHPAQHYTLSTGGIWKEEGATVFHMKHRINRIAQDVEGVKADEVLPKVKEHLTLP